MGFGPLAAGFAAGLPPLVVEAVAGVVALLAFESEPDADAAVAMPAAAVEPALSPEADELSEEEEEPSADEEPALTLAPSRLSVR